MRLRRLAPGLVVLFALHPAPALATTAASLSDRIRLDGRLDDYAADEFVLDPLTAFPEAPDDSRWGSDNDIARVALTWDQARLYLAVEFSAAASGVLVMIGGGPGGVQTLDATGEFRRAIDLPFPANLLVLATPGATPRVARADATHVFGLVDAALVPAALTVLPDGAAGLEAWIPWGVVDPAQPLRISVVLTAEVGTGAGDAAPDPRAVLPAGRHTRAVVDRWIVFTADEGGDGVPDVGVAPRTRVAVAPDALAGQPAGDAGIDITVTPKVFAPDRNETATLTLRTGAGTMENVSGRCLIHALDGRRVRTLNISAVAATDAVTVTWDGRDDSGRVCDGGAYAAAFAVEFTAGGARQRATARAGVAVVR